MTEERVDLLISRAVDCLATGGEWEELAGLAGSDPTLWRQVAMTLRDRGGFGRAVEGLTAVADRIELPAARPAVHTAAPKAPAPAPWRHRGALWGGWAVAAMVALTWGLAVLMARAPAPGPAPAPEPPSVAERRMLDRPPTAADLASWPADDLRAAWLDRGRRENLVLGELPEKVLLDTRNTPSGEGYEILFFRPVLERAIVPDLYEFRGRDETGRPTPVPVRYQTSGPPR